MERVGASSRGRAVYLVVGGQRKKTVRNAMGPEDVAAKDRMVAQMSSTRADRERKRGEGACDKPRRDPDQRRAAGALYAAEEARVVAVEYAKRDVARKQREVLLSQRRQAEAEEDAENAGENLKREREKNVTLRQNLAGLQKTVQDVSKSNEGLRWQVDKLPSNAELRCVERKLAARTDETVAAERRAAELQEETRHAEMEAVQHQQ